ncbi:MAG: ferredoxin, partial [Candidatus Dadabacteria bacterium]|nr:ferredoxin [Candidatus Dadabacteria bacterium]
DEIPEKWSEYTAKNKDFFEGTEGLEPAKKD